MTRNSKSRIEAFEMAFKMQTEATDAFDIKKEPKEVLDLYGPSEMGARCWSRGGSSSAACASCRSAPAAGIITAISNARCRKEPATSTAPLRR
jgi:hypothetical protein